MSKDINNIPDFNIVVGCGKHNRIIYRYKDICYIGCFKGTYNECKDAISEKYNEDALTSYISKLDKAYTKFVVDSIVITDINDVVKMASRDNHLDIIQYLVSLGADVTADDNCAMRHASINGHLEVAKYLVSLGTDVTADDNCAVKWASENEHLDVVEYLVSVGATLNK